MSVFRIGLEIGEDHFALAIFRRRGSHMDRVSVEEIPRHGQGLEAEVGALQELLLEKVKCRQLPAAVVINRRDVIHRDLVLPAVGRREMSALVARAIERLREESREELVTAWAAQGRLKGTKKKKAQVRILLAAAPKRQVEEALQLAKQTGLEVRLIGTGVPFLFSASALSDEKEDLALAHLGRESSTLSVVSNGRLLASRDIGHGLVASAHRRDTDLLQLFESKVGGGPLQEVPPPNPSHRLGGIIAEFDRTLVNFASESGTEPKRLWIVSDRVLDDESLSVLQEGLGLPCERLPRFALGSDVQAPLAVSAALGLEANDILALRRFKRAMRKGTPLLPKLLSVGTAAGILAAGYFLFENLDVQRSALVQEIDRSRALLSQLIREKPEPPPPDPYVEPVRQLLASEAPDSKKLLDAIAGVVPASARLDRVLLTPGKDGWKLELTGRVVGERASDAASEMRRLFESLQAAELFSQAEYDTTTQRQEGEGAELGFQVQGTLRGDS
ncbi:MAG: hypothetical protein RL885_11515 [Planctomycetota bacterium]